MRTGGPGREEDEVPRLKPLLAFRVPQRGAPRDDKEPFLFRFLLVVGTYSLARRQLIDAESGALRA